MNLVIDFGNTLVKTALFDGGRLVHLESNEERSGSAILRIADSHPGIGACILSSVVSHPPELEHALAERFPFILLDEHTPVPLINRYATPATLGKDRLAAAVGGAARFPGRDVLVVTAGTALTFDFVGRDSAYPGGSIAPGLQMRFRALHTFTGKLPLVSCADEAALIGTTTEESIRSGVVNGMTAEIEGVANRYRELYPDLAVVFSGGDLDYFVKRLKISIFALPNIVIHGLQQILEFNVHTAR